jgi:hypothetical protein
LAKAGSKTPLPAAQAPPPLAGVPWDVVQNEMRVEGRVILAGVVQVIGGYVQNEIRRQAVESTGEFDRHGRGRPQTKMEAAG